MRLVTPDSGGKKDPKLIELEVGTGDGTQSISTSNKDIQSFLKETMAGSMRQVIKDELQAWLGLRYQDKEEARETKTKEALQREEEDKEEGEIGEDLNNGETSPIREGPEEDRSMMISPMKEIVEEEEREAKKGRDRRTSARQANQRQSKDYEADTVTRAAKRKEHIVDKGTHDDIFSFFDIIPVHLILHIAKSCGMGVDLGEHDLVELINSTKERRGEASSS